MDAIHLNRFRSHRDNRVHSLPPCKWEVIAKFFLDEHLLVESKEDAPLFNAVQYKDVDEIPPETDDWGIDNWTGDPFTKRRKSNVKKVDLLIIDYDNGLTIDEAKERFFEYEHVGYTSYNHLVKNGTQKFRLVFPLETPVPAWIERDEFGREIDKGEWYSIQAALSKFAGPCDPASFNPNQIYFIPSVHPNNVELAEVWRNKGKVLDWRELPRPKARVFSRSVAVANASGNAKGATGDSLHPDLILDTAEGPVRVKDVQRRYQGVRCPFHDDKSGSEFVNRSPNTDNVYLVCKRCGTKWMNENEKNVTKKSALDGSKELPDDKQTKTQAQLVDELLDLPDIPRIAYVDAKDRRRVIKQLADIGKSIVSDRGHWSEATSAPTYKSHIIYLPEGAGKSRLAVDLAKQGEKIVFACKAWSQAFEKYEDFKAMGLEYQFSVQLFASKDAKARQRFGVPVVRSDQTEPFRTGRILDEETIEAFIAANPHLSPDFIRLSWEFFGADVLSFERIPEPIFDENGELVEGSEDSNYIGREVNILITTFAQLRILKVKNQHIPREWIVWFDDPDISDVVDIDPYDPKRWGELSDKQLKEKTRQINGRRYYRRPFQQSLGYSYRFHKCIYTTTEKLTLEAIQLMMRRRREENVVHDKMNHLAGGKITVLGTEMVYKRFDGIVPLVTRRLNKLGFPTILIADGLQSELNHSNNKGKNYLNETNILVELSTPHPARIQTYCDALDNQNRNEVNRLLMLDQMHQSIGRNSGYRNKPGYECVVIADKKVHRYLVHNTRYKLDTDNSVIIDRLSSMSRKESRTKKTATPLVQQLVSLLNNPGNYLCDKRKSKPDINHVVKQIDNDSKRRKLIVRLLIALSNLAGVRFDSKKDSNNMTDPQAQEFWSLGIWLLESWLDEDEVQETIEDYESEMELFGI